MRLPNVTKCRANYLCLKSYCSGAQEIPRDAEGLLRCIRGNDNWCSPPLQDVKGKVLTNLTRFQEKLVSILDQFD